MPSTPRSTTARASSSVWIPLTTSLPGHCDLIQAKSSKVRLGSNTVFKYSPTVPGQRSSEAKASGSVVNKSNHHRGCPIASRTVRSVSAGGMDIPLRTSRSRAPATGTSTVTSMVSNPAAATRRTNAIERSRSRHIYSWNHLRPCGTAMTRSSMAQVARVDSENGIPAAAAARAPAISPSVCIKRVNPVGAIPNGKTVG
ncbi:Uncharacterised protein [Mycobacterium tuberculosis]|uniref:Uncharacterized protein n=3 Tax=Mycobacterium tuberculosis TaxID=1773 RepID=A0A655A5C3_MYCTX|nr:Uncharacterised protein [Mycobacterium tuberculosis]CKR04715.1 Uncharacterised protein [Mycobacterium tuberculosis]CKR98106.1 Uncharacterised protein [Mycobacterium tuberculosis]